MPWIPVARLEDLPVGAGLSMAVQGRRMALFRTVDDRVYAIEDRCPHADLPIAEGELTGTIVTCPHHGYRLDITTGASPRTRVFCVPHFAVRIDDEDVLIDPTPLDPPP